MQEKAEGAGGAKHLLAETETGFISDKREDTPCSWDSIIVGPINVKNVVR